MDSNDERGEEDVVRGRLAEWDTQQPVVTTVEGVLPKDEQA